MTDVELADEYSVLCEEISEWLERHMVEAAEDGLYRFEPERSEKGAAFLQTENVISHAGIRIAKLYPRALDAVLTMLSVEVLSFYLLASHQVFPGLDQGQTGLVRFLMKGMEDLQAPRGGESSRLPLALKSTDTF